MLVMTLDGKVIRKIESQGTSIDGDQLIWDGKDIEGDYVSSLKHNHLQYLSHPKSTDLHRYLFPVIQFFL